jgi:hypothetical protein
MALNRSRSQPASNGRDLENRFEISELAAGIMIASGNCRFPSGQGQTGDLASPTSERINDTFIAQPRC